MSNLIYTAITSLDGYIADASGNFDWSAPDAEVHQFVNDRVRSIGTFLFGRRMYEVMSAWEDPDLVKDEGPELQDFAQIWHAAEKVVYSSSLDAVTTRKMQLERHFEPEVVRRLKEASTLDLSIGGAYLAAHALRAGLVDEIQVYFNPVVVGGGTRALPDDIRLDLELVDEHRFGNGVIFVHYRCRK